MKKIFTGLALIASTTLFGQITLLEENFDASTLPATWTVIDNDGNTVDEQVQEYTEAWIYKEDPINAGNGTASSTSFFSPVDRADRWLITPQITLGAESNYISWNSMSYDPSFPDSYKVMISTTGNTVADFTDTLVVVSNETPYWSSHTELLDEYVNQNIYIAFVNTTFDGFKLHLDSVYVREQDPLALTKEKLNVGVYPNPVEDVFHISTGTAVIQEAKLFNSFGQMVMAVQGGEKARDLDIDISELNPGVYIVAIHTSEGTIRRRIVKN